MKPEEKAKDLVDKMHCNPNQPIEYPKECALVAVDEIIKASKSCDDCAEEGSIEMAYWGKVRNEIEKL